MPNAAPRIERRAPHPHTVESSHPLPRANQMQSRSASIAGSIFGAIGVLLGAFGAHALRDTLDVRGLELWHTATLYLFVHALALLAVGLSAERTKSQAAGE